MSERNKRNFLRQRIAIIGLVYAINLILIALNYWDIGRAIEIQLNINVGHEHRLSSQIWQTTNSIFIGEIGALALWASISSTRWKIKLPVYFAAAAQLAFANDWTHPVHLRLGRWDLARFSYLFWESAIHLVLTYLALLLASRHVRLVELSGDAGDDRRMRISIAQVVLFMTVVAILIASFTTEISGKDTYLQTFRAIVHGGCIYGLVPAICLMIVTTFRHPLIQIFPCIVLRVLLVVPYLAVPLYGGVIFRSWQSFSVWIVTSIWIVLVPVLWVRSLRWFGFEIRSFDKQTKEVDSNPFVEAALAKEANN